MHESSIIKDLVQKISSIAFEHHANKVTGVTVKLGALSHISPNHLREHFVHAVRGTIAEGAWLKIEVVTDTTNPLSQEVLIDSIEVSVS